MDRRSAGLARRPQVVYVRVVVNEKTDDYDTSLWIVPTDGREAPRALTSGTRDSSPRWSPDGKRLAFVRAGAGQPPQIHVISLSGGEARRITDLPRGAGAPAWSPDGDEDRVLEHHEAGGFREEDGRRRPRATCA